MTIQEALKALSSELKLTSQTTNQAWLEAESLLAHTLKRDKSWLLAHGDESISSSSMEQANKLVHRRSKGEPLAHLLGKALFLSQEFEVTKATLIPRPETEEMVEDALKHISILDPKICLVDIGTGSGAIAIACAQKIRGRVIASDRSAKALTIAKRNAKRLIQDTTRQPIFIRATSFAASLQKKILKPTPSRLVVIANLPYLPMSDKKKLSKSVVKFEPASALFSKQEGLHDNLQLLKQLAYWQEQTNLPLSLWMEFDPPQAQTLRRLAKDLITNADILIKQDACGLDRWMRLTIDSL